MMGEGVLIPFKNTAVCRLFRSDIRLKMRTFSKLICDVTDALGYQWCAWARH